MRKIFSIFSLILGIVFFAIFMVAACAAYYLTAGVFVTARLAVLYAGLGLLGAFSIVFRGYMFSALFYIGCALGWVTGRYVSTLEGEFAPTAGVIATFFLIGCFALVGLILEIGRLKRRRRKRAERRQAEWLAEEQRQNMLLAEQKAKVSARAEENDETAVAQEPPAESV